MIAIIGAGVAGNAVAYKLASIGHEVSVFEEHNEIGKPLQCTGLVSSSFANIVKPKNEFIVNRAKTHRIFSPNGNFIEINLKNPDIILDRPALDKYLAIKASEAGAIINLNSKFIGIKKGKELSIKISDSAKKQTRIIKAKALIGADGPLSKVAKSAGIFGKRKFFFGVQATSICQNDNIIETYLFPGGFGWIVPENEKIARIGCISENTMDNAFSNFQNIFKKRGKRKISMQAGIIPIYNPSNKIQNKNIYLVGDAAEQVKATTGGGIVPSLIASNILSKSIFKNKDYEKEIKRNLGKELEISLYIRKILSHMEEKDCNRLIMLCKNQKVKEVLQEFSRDKPSDIALRLIFSEPRFIAFAKFLF